MAASPRPVVFTSALASAEGRTNSVLVLDDRQDALQSPGFADDWRLWLRLSNLLMDASPIYALSEVGGAVPAQATPALPAVGDAEWAALLVQAMGDELDVLIALAAHGAPIPQLGLEIGDGIPVSFAWPDRKVAASSQLTEEDRAELTAAGWIVVPATFDSLVAALERR